MINEAVPRQTNQLRMGSMRYTRLRHICKLIQCQLTQTVHPDSFVYSILSLIVLSMTLLVLLFVMTGIYQRRHKPPVKSVGYHRLTMDGSEPLENGGV